MRSTKLPEDVKSQQLKEAEAHLAQAKAERSYYYDQVDKNRKTWSSLCDMEQSAPNSRNISIHLSFDYAQQIHYPHNPLQPGPTYFKSARKCQIFGVCCEGSSIQMNYLIDEA